MAVTVQPGAMPICMIEKSVFVTKCIRTGLPPGWQEDAYGRLNVIDSDFTVLSPDGDDLFSGRDQCFEINSITDFEAAKDTLLRRPMLVTTATCKMFDGFLEFKREFRNEFVVFINTEHPEITSVLREAFDLASKLFDEGRNFRVTVPYCHGGWNSSEIGNGFLYDLLMEIDLNNSIEACYRTDVKKVGIIDRLFVFNCAFYLTHGVQAPTMMDRLSDCGRCPSFLCYLFFPLCCFPYKFHKECIKRVVEVSIGGYIPTNFRFGTADFQLNNSLFYPEIETATVEEKNRFFGTPYAIGMW